MLKQIFVGLLVGGIGSSIIFFSIPLADMIGRNARAEKNLGGTRNALVLFGFFITILGLTILFGMTDISGESSLKGFETGV